MNILSSVGIGVLCALAALLLRECKSPFVPLVTLGGGLLLFALFLPSLSEALTFAKTLEGQLGEAVPTAVGKVLAVGFISGIGCEICTELGAPSLASKLDLCGKIEIFLLSLPTLKELFARALAFLS